METIHYYPQGTCSVEMFIDHEDGIIQEVRIIRGCRGNTQGLAALLKGMKLEEKSEELNWKLCGSATDLIEPQSMFIGGEFSLMRLILNDDLNDHISSHFHHPILNSHIDECK